MDETKKLMAVMPIYLFIVQFPFTIGITCLPVGKYHLRFHHRPLASFINQDGIT